MRLNEFSNEKLDEYGSQPGGPSYGGTQSQSTAPTSPTTPSTTSTPQQQTQKVKAKQLKQDDQITVMDKNNKPVNAKIVSQAGKRTAAVPNDNENVVVAQDENGETFVFDKEQDLDIPGVTESADLLNRFDGKSRMASLIRKQEKKIKRLIRDAKAKTQGEPLFEINFNNAEVIKSALDAQVSCGFEAETLWPAEGAATFNPDTASWEDIKQVIRDQIDFDAAFPSIRKIEKMYDKWVQEQPSYKKQVASVMATEFKARLSDDSFAEKFLDQAWAEVADEDLVDEWESFLGNNEAENPDDMPDQAFIKWINDAEKYDDAAGKKALELYTDWIKTKIKTDPEIMATAVEKAKRSAPIEKFAKSEGGWAKLIDKIDLYLDFEAVTMDADYEGIADKIRTITDVNIRTSNTYAAGGGDTAQSYWRIEPDSSISKDQNNQQAAEIVSPVYDSPRQMLMDMNKLFDLMQKEGASTNNSTGLHVTMSIPEAAGEPNRLKMALLLGDQYLLKSFGRQFNTYAHSQQENIMAKAKRLVDGQYTTDETIKSVKTLEAILSRGISYGKYSSINFKRDKNSAGNQLVEFRIAGNGDYEKDFKKVTQTVVRYAAIMEAGNNPEAYKEDYYKAIYKIVQAAASGDGLSDKEREEMDKGAGVDIPQTKFTDLVKSLKTGKAEYLSRLEDLERAYNGDTLAQQMLMWELLKNVVNTDFKYIPLTINTVTAFREAVRQWGFNSTEFFGDFVSVKLNRASNTLLAKRFKPIQDYVAAYEKLTRTKVDTSKLASGPSKSITIDMSKTYYITKSNYDAIAKGQADKFNTRQVVFSDSDVAKQLMDALWLLRDGTATDTKKTRLIDKWGNGDETQAKKRAQGIATQFSNEYGFLPLSMIDIADAGPNAWITVDALHLDTYMERLGIAVHQLESLEHTLKMLESIDKAKLDQAWKKATSPKKVEESFIDHNTPDELKRIMSKPLLGSDIKGQMQAYAALPVKHMISAFRQAIAEMGKDVDLRFVVKQYLPMLHPTDKKKLGITEGEFKKADMLKADQPYMSELLNKIRSGTPIRLVGRKDPVVIKPEYADVIANIMFPQGDINQAQTTEKNNREVYVPVNPEALSKPIYVETTDGEKFVLTKVEKTDLYGEKSTHNNGDVAEALVGAAVADYFRTGGKPTVAGIKAILTAGTVEDAKTIKKFSWSTKVKHAEGNADNLYFAVALSARSFDPTLKWAKGEFDNKVFDNIAASAASFSEDVTVGGVKAALERIQADTNTNTVQIVTDGVGDQKGTKADLVMSIDNQRFNLISLKVGDIKQFGQVSGHAYENISTLFEKTFGVQLPDEAPNLDWSTAQESMASFKKIKDNVVYQLQQELAGNGASDIAVIDRIYNGIRYHATKDEDVDLVIIGQTGQPKYNILSFGPELNKRMAQMNYQIVDENDPKKNSITLKIVATGGPLFDKFKSKYNVQPVLFQVRMGLISENNKYTMRNRIEMGPVLKFLADKGWQD